MIAPNKANITPSWKVSGKKSGLFSRAITKTPRMLRNNPSNCFLLITSRNSTKEKKITQSGEEFTTITDAETEV
jgi:hypothetical protein